MNQEEFDVGPTEVPLSEIERLNASLSEAIALEKVIDQTEEDLKRMRGDLHKIKTLHIPDMMTSMQLDEVTFKGWQVKINDFVSGSLPKDPDRRKKALDWLVDNDGGGLIKTELKLHFAKSQHNEALSVASELEHGGYAPEVDSSVHSSTLKSYARQRIKDGDPIDPETLGLYVGKVADIKMKKGGGR